jgi:carbamoyl-phosphate synthase large subunit
MPKREDIKSILIIGAGPIVIGQGCEFDYSGTQACRALKEEGYRVILINSNPATIMTDPGLADATYIEPIDWETVALIIEKERPEALLPTMGGQTALNCALDLVKEGVLEKYGVELIGASQDAIDKAEDRERFKAAMEKIGLKVPAAYIAHSLEEAKQQQAAVGFPTIIRPSFTLAGSGGGIAYNAEEFEEICRRGLDLSPTNELLIETSIIGWKEYELEVVRDKNDNCIIVCSIENIDPMGVHTGDSITVAPQQTLTDKEYQIMREAAVRVLQEIGVETGGSNVQFAVNPADGEMHVIEMNPRVSRSSALASKATGFPIAKIAAKLAVGYTLDELKNEITGGQTPASFEPTIDYVVVKYPRFNFDKFPSADSKLTTQMKSVGESMAMGRTFQAALQKAIRGLEIGKYGLESSEDEMDETIIRGHLQNPGWDRLWYIAQAFRQGLSFEIIQETTKIDPWFLVQIQDLIIFEESFSKQTLEALTPELIRQAKRKGFSDHRLATLIGVTEKDFRQVRHQADVRPVYKHVDTCSAEFSTPTAYMYSCYDEVCEANPTDKKKIMVLGGGPNRIGQGIEFDYCCVHAALAMREDGYETIMVNCNPETVSTDFDVSDRLYFESLTLEDVLEIVHLEQPAGVIVHYGGQTPLKLANDLEAEGVKIIGTSPEAIDHAEDRERFQQLIDKLGLKQPPNGIARNLDEGMKIADEIGFPLVVRPSYVLGGRAMEIVHTQDELTKYLTEAVHVSPEQPVLLDRFLDDAIEVDVDAVSDGKTVLIGSIMEHIEQAGVHSGDSSCCLPPHSLSTSVVERVSEQMIQMAKALGVVGLTNAQFAIQGEDIFILEVNPRASRTVPFVSKAIGVPLAKVGARCMAGQSLAEQGYQSFPKPHCFSVKQSIFPFVKFAGVDPILGPEMRSTGEVMGIGCDFVTAFSKAYRASGNQIEKQSGKVFISVRDADKMGVVPLARCLLDLGFELVATRGTQDSLSAAGLECEIVNKVMEGRPHIVDLIKNNKVSFIINTTEGRQAIADSFTIRRSAVQNKISYTTTLAGAKAIVLALRSDALSIVRSLQDLEK